MFLEHTAQSRGVTTKGRWLNSGLSLPSHMKDVFLHETNQLDALLVPIEKPKDLAYSILYFSDPFENVLQ